ncbi:GNAT family N-acetyltransferase [uncultured Tateyamaria sp.]|uniref:GNAT family N-acetyltransferase n=1 Tax=uncultured Tateyamaria sp. TaxID=455651 RepID=UPI0026146675|nr:GNAT family N-acetyltransferase [uncultured Tateyamaria sp.]
MKDGFHMSIRSATARDAADLAILIDIAGEGIPSWLWTTSATDGQSPLDIGMARACRTDGGFSYANALVAERDGDVIGMGLSYAIDAPPTVDPNDLPAPITPFVALEAQSVGTWYVNALAVRACARGGGIGTALLSAVEETARGAGYDRLSIQVYEQNTGAVRLYRRAGFALAARAPVRLHPCQPYYTGDVLLLIKPVDRNRAV